MKDTKKFGKNLMQEKIKINEENINNFKKQFK